MKEGATDNDPPKRSPPTSRVLLAHMLATVLLQGSWYAVSGMMPVLARKRFDASDWQTVMVTAAMPTLMILSIFWGDLLRRWSIRTFLLVHWASAMIPLACGAFATNFWQLLACHVLAAAGAAGWSPVSGDLLKGFYKDQVRGRALGFINSAMYGGWMLMSFLIGKGLDYNERIFRFYLPAAAVLYLVGVLTLRRLVKVTGMEEARPPTLGQERPLGLRALLDPIIHTRQILRADRSFYRYEAAFMTYGIGWMICAALIPVLATDRLHMEYTQYAGSTQMVYTSCLLVMTYLAGWVMDRIGAVRISGLSFVWLAFYPIGLIFSFSVPAVAISTVIYGTAMAGVNIGWMLGPVALAPDRERVAQYVAIHATMVGIRGTVGQFVGMLVYRLTGSFTWSYSIAAAAFLWAAWQMWKLHGMLRLPLPLGEGQGEGAVLPLPAGEGRSEGFISAASVNERTSSLSPLECE